MAQKQMSFVPEEKKCSKCHKIKPLSVFAKGEGTYGKRSYCGPCGVIWNTAWRRRNVEKNRAYSIKHAHSEKGQSTYYKRMYGITKIQYDALMTQQGGVCAICGKTNPSERKLSVDHNHTTGKVRGLLCNQCNVMLGLGGESICQLKSAIKYLEKQ